jgi:hypothetical protein
MIIIFIDPKGIQKVVAASDVSEARNPMRDKLERKLWKDYLRQRLLDFDEEIQEQALLIFEELQAEEREKKVEAKLLEVIYGKNEPKKEAKNEVKDVACSGEPENRVHS